MSRFKKINFKSFWFTLQISLMMLSITLLFVERCNAQVPSITISSDKKIYNKTDKIQIKATIANPGEEITIDQIIVYLIDNKIREC